jgi:hypothetical protein
LPNQKNTSQSSTIFTFFYYSSVQFGQHSLSQEGNCRPPHLFTPSKSRFGITDRLLTQERSWPAYARTASYDRGLYVLLKPLRVFVTVNVPS